MLVDRLMWQMARANTGGPQRAITIKVIYLISVSAVLMFALTHDCIAHCNTPLYSRYCIIYNYYEELDKVLFAVLFFNDLVLITIQIYFSLFGCVHLKHCT